MTLYNAPTPDYNYLDKLNPQQREAVVYNDGPSLVIAGAGSGKTRVLTYKIIHLISLGYEPNRIVALTFTNKAAREMKERIAAVAGFSVANRIWMGTFHSIFLRILHLHADKLGFKDNFTIYDAADSRALIKSIINEMCLDDKAYRPNTIQSVISNAKNRLVSPDAYLQDNDYYYADRQANRPLTGKIYEAYCRRCRLAQAMDFDDILLYMNILLRDFPDVAKYYQKFFRYILVDEYQDTNFAQHLAIMQMCGEDRHLCVVGDDAQSIYSFRGAEIDNILHLSKQLKGLKVFKLERNYRSTQTIINAAGSLIKKNHRQMKKNVYSENEVGNPIEVINTYSDIEEARIIASRIMESRLTNHDSYNDYAIFYRTNAQSRTLEEELRHLDIAYRIYGGLSFYQRKEIKDAVCYFRTAVNPDDDQALLRVINYPKRGIGRTTIDKLKEAATRHDTSVWDVLNDLQKYGVAVHSGTQRKLADFTAIIRETVDANNREGSDAYSVAQLVMNRSGMIAVLAYDNTPEAISQKENLTELLNATKQFADTARDNDTNEDMYSFLSEISLATDQDSDNADGEITDKSGVVTLMTVHAAKGLEFKHVYIVGLEEELFPSAMTGGIPDAIEEERRLMYVAITRAEKTCTISYAQSRFRNGQIVYSKPSRFIKEIDKQYLHFTAGKGAYGSSFARKNTYRTSSNSSIYPSFPKTEAASLAKKQPVTTQAKPEGDMTMHEAAELTLGMKIFHNVFGEGVITKIDTSTSNHIIHANFSEAGEKKLLLKFAKFIIP